MSGAILLPPVHRWLARSLTTVPLISPESVSSDALDALERAVTLFREGDASGVGTAAPMESGRPHRHSRVVRRRNVNGDIPS